MSGLKKLLAVSFSVFLFALSFALVTGREVPTRDARADYEPGGVGVVGFNQIDQYLWNVLLSDGRILRLDTGTTPDHGPIFWPEYLNGVEWLTLPVPIAEIKFWSAAVVVTRENVVWAVVNEPYTNVRSWRNLGTPPGLPVIGTASSVGDLKSKFGAKR